MTQAPDLLTRLRVKPTIILPDMGERTVDVATSIRQLMVERAEAADVIEALYKALHAITDAYWGVNDDRNGDGGQPPDIVRRARAALAKATP